MTFHKAGLGEEPLKQLQNTRSGETLKLIYLKPGLTVVVCSPRASSKPQLQLVCILCAPDWEHAQETSSTLHQQGCELVHRKGRGCRV